MSDKMKHLKKTKSILLKLLTPIFAATISLLLFAVITLYAIYIRQTEQALIQSNLEILRQTDTSMQLVHQHISQVSTDLIQKTYLADFLIEPMEDVKDEWIGRQAIASLFAASPNAMVDYEILVVGVNGLAVSSGNGGTTMNADEILGLPLFQRALAGKRIVYGGRPRGLTYSTADSAVILGCRPLIKSDGTLCGGIFISIPEQSLRHFYQSFINPSTNILLLSSDGTILSSNLTEDIGTQAPELLEAAAQNRTDSINYRRIKGSEILLSRYLSYYDSYIISRISPMYLYQSFLPKLQTCAVIALTLLLLLLSIIGTVRKNLLPLRNLADHMAREKDVPTPLNVISSTSEIQMITTAYNQMTDTLQGYLAELNAAHEKQRQDELNLLQMQINPHFLYNTLQSIKHLIEMQNDVDACQIIDALISLLRSTLGKTNTMVSVSDEIKNVQNYISIIEPRYGGLITAEVHVDPECLKYEMPNLLLQPLVENAFFHAFQSTKSGHIRIFISLIHENLSCEIIDNGDGIPQEQLSEMLKNKPGRHFTTRIGISNVKERLHILYPDNSHFQITSEPGYGTSIALSFPASLHGKKQDSE